MKKTPLSLLVAALLLSLALATPSRAENTNVVKIGGDITIAEGQKVKNALAVGGQITVHGTLEGHAMAIGGSVVLTRTARVEGNVISVGGVIVVGRGARVRGTLRELNSSDISASLASVLSRCRRRSAYISTTVLTTTSPKATT